MGASAGKKPATATSSRLVSFKLAKSPGNVNKILIQTTVALLLLTAGNDRAFAWKPADIDEALPATTAYAAGDYGKAAAIYSVLAANGNAVAQFNLGTMYAKGQYGLRNPKEAIQWYFLAAEQGYADAQHELGMLYLEGAQLPQNYPKAWQLFKSAADQGHAQAMVQLASMYMQGTGVLQDSALATRWYRMAAERGNVSAQRSLGTAYALGLGVEPNPVLSYMWLTLALSRAENAEKQKELTEQIGLAAKDMTEDQVREARILAATCTSNHFQRC